jgi:hypothetical protein
MFRGENASVNRSRGVFLKVRRQASARASHNTVSISIGAKLAVRYPPIPAVLGVAKLTQASELDRNGAKTAAAALFDKLDVDHDGTVDAKELHGRISKKDWKTADPDSDKTICKDEYLNYVETLFKQADKDGEGTLDKNELRSASGRKLEKLLK